MRFRSSKRLKYIRHPRARSSYLKQKDDSFQNKKLFLESEKTTFESIKPIALVIFTLDTGSLALLFNSSEKDIVSIIVLGFGIFISMLILLGYVSFLKVSVKYINSNFQKYIDLHQKSLFLLQAAIYCCIITFEIVLGIWFYNHSILIIWLYSYIEKFLSIFHSAILQILSK